MIYQSADMPAWVNGLATAIGETIRYKRDGGTEVRYRSQERAAPRHRLELAPAVLTIEADAPYPAPEFE